MKSILKILITITLLSSTVLALEKVSIQLKWLHQFQFAGYYAAKEKGFYEEVGLDVEILERVISVDHIEPVLQGEVEYGIADSILMLYKAKQNPVVIIAPIFQHSPSVLMTLKSSGLDSPYKLDGKRAVFYEKDADGFSILAMLKKLDIKPNLLRKREKDDYKKLLNGETDILPVYLSNEPFLFHQLEVPVHIINPSNYGFDLYGDILFTNEKEAKEHPDRVKRFKEATIKGWQYALANKEEIIALIKEKYNQNKSIEHLRFEAEAIEQVISQKTIPIGTLDEGRIEFIIDLYKQYGLLDGEIEISSFIFKDFVDNLNLTKKEREYLVNKEKLTMCIDPNWMPFEKLDNGKHIGMSADYFEIFEKEIGIPIEVIPTATWKESLTIGKQKRCDIFSLVMPNKKRREFLDFSTPYLQVPLVVVTNTEEFFVSDITSILDKKLAIVDGYAYKDILKEKYPNINFVTVKDIDEGLEKVNSNEVFGFIGTLATTAYKIQKNFPGQLKVTGKFDETWNLGVGTRNDEPLLKSIFNKAVNHISEEKKQEILNRWVSVSFERKTDIRELLKWLSGVILFFGTIIFVIVLSNRKLNREIEARKEAEKKAKAFIKLVDENVITSTTDLNGVIIYASTAFCKVSKYTKEELIGQKHNILRHPYMPTDLYQNLWETINKDEVWSGELQNRAKDGTTYWVRSTISPVFQDGIKVGYTAIREDITDKKTIEEISITDGLTEIFNRRHFNEVFPKTLNLAKRNNDFITFIILDIDHFKQYNDNYGHQKGDEALKAVAKVLKNSLHRAGDYCFRLGGEEFGILFTSIDKTHSTVFARKLKESIKNLNIKHEYNSDYGYLTASFGMYCDNSKYIPSEELFYRKADELLYIAKKEGRNRVITN